VNFYSSFVGGMRNWCLSPFDGEEIDDIFTSREISYFSVALALGSVFPEGLKMT